MNAPLFYIALWCLLGGGTQGKRDPVACAARSRQLAAEYEECQRRPSRTKWRACHRRGEAKTARWVEDCLEGRE